MKKNEHLSVLGIGPFYGIIIITITILGILLSLNGTLDFGTVSFLKFHLLFLASLISLVQVY